MITLQNYETWFLLYADNELSAEEQTMVLNFVSSNPELNSEFESIQQVKLAPEQSVAMPDKESLKSRDIVQLESVYRLEPDLSIVYPNKQELYRKTPVISISKWLSYSAAASVLFMLGIYWWMLGDSASIEPAIVKSVPIVVESAIDSKKEFDTALVSEKPKVNSAYQFVQTKVSTQDLASSKSIDPQLVAKSETVKSEIEQEIIQPEKVDRVREQSNFTNEVLEAANERMRAIPIATVSMTPSNSPNMEALIKTSIPSENEGTAFKGLFRKFSRKLLHEDEDEDVKVIQVANFHIHVKN